MDVSARIRRPILDTSRAIVATLVLLALSLLPAASALAQWGPSATLPALIPLVGHDGVGNADPAGEFTVTVRDIANNPMPGVQVAIDLSACTDLRIAMVQPFAGVTADCTLKNVSALTDASGIARFRIVGGAMNPGGIPGPLANAAKVYGDGVLFGSRTITAFDQNGVNGLNANDMSAWLSDFGTGQPFGRSDYDASGMLGANDLSRWVMVYFGGGSSQGAGSLPGGLCP